MIAAWLRALARRAASVKKPERRPWALKAEGSSPVWMQRALTMRLTTSGVKALSCSVPQRSMARKTAPFEIAALAIRVSSATTGGPISKTRESSSTEPVLVRPSTIDRQGSASDCG